ncbi:MAG: transcriptional regulator, partial [Phycisphaerales bacterium]|nr:transcriptional regulator [Phycisphaerales bacterium]
MQTAVQRREKTQGTRRVAFYASERSEYAARVLSGVLRYADDHVGFLLREFQDDVTGRDGPAGRWAGDPVPPWDGWGADGVVAILPHGPAVVRWAMAGGAPVVSVGGDYRGQLPTVYVDPLSVADLAIDHFLVTGYVHFAFVGVRGLPTVDLRRQCLAGRLADLGQPLLSYELETNPWPGLYDLEARAAAEPGLSEFLRSAPKPLAVLATSDYVGRVVCMASGRLGLGVPQEVGVLGVDNYAAARASIPPLSSIQAPGEDVGYQAMAMLDAAVRGGAGGRPGGALASAASPPAVGV